MTKARFRPINSDSILYNPVIHTTRRPLSLFLLSTTHFKLTTSTTSTIRTLRWRPTTRGINSMVEWQLDRVPRHVNGDALGRAHYILRAKSNLDSFPLCSHTTRQDVTPSEGGTRNNAFLNDSALNSSLRGLPQLDPKVAAFLYAFVSSDSKDSNNSDGSNSEPRITPESLAHDVRRLGYLAGQFEGLFGKIYGAEGKREASADVIRSVMGMPRHDLPLIVAILLHTEFRKENWAFIPADPSTVILHSEVAQWLLKSRGNAPVALVTESCFSTNIMSLPYKGFVGSDESVVWERVHDGENQEWKLVPLMVQFAATMPEERAASFRSIGSVYLRALYNAWRKPFGSMMTSVQEDMDSTLEGRNHSQHHVVYASRIIGDEEMIWPALGLETKL